jgi:hypothetical protein
MAVAHLHGISLLSNCAAVQDPREWQGFGSDPHALVDRIHADMAANGVGEGWQAAGLSVDDGMTTETFLPAAAFEAAVGVEEARRAGAPLVVCCVPAFSCGYLTLVVSVQRHLYNSVHSYSCFSIAQCGWAQ